MHIKESKYQKRTGTKASAVGVGSGGKQFAELRTLGISDRALRLIDEHIAEGQPFHAALRLSVLATDLPFHNAIESVQGANPKLGFYGCIRQYLRIQRRKAAESKNNHATAFLQPNVA